MKKCSISIIIPVYNVELYIEKCLNSIIQQTYKDYEIVVVDDGSTDSSGMICDRYADMYQFIKVLHKENEGQAKARNYAMPYTHGEYIVFIDADDYVENKYLEVLMNTQKTTNADIVVAQYIVETLQGKMQKKDIGNKGVIELTAEEAMDRLCYEKEIGVSPCGKLILAKYVAENPFPEGYIYEDLATTYKYIGAASRIVVVDDILYHYVIRPHSTTQIKWKEKTMDVMIATQGLLDYIDRYFPNVHGAAIQRYFFSANEVYVRAFGEKNYMTIVNPIREKLRGYWKEIKQNKDIKSVQKIRYGMMVFSPNMYRRIWLTYKKAMDILSE